MAGRKVFVLKWDFCNKKEGFAFVESVEEEAKRIQRWKKLGGCYAKDDFLQRFTRQKSLKTYKLKMI